MTKVFYFEGGHVPEGHRLLTEMEVSTDPGLTTVDEPWTVEPPEKGHVYNAACEFALTRLGGPRGKSPWPRCLVIGSPLFERRGLVNNGWMVTYVDVRQPPGIREMVVEADAVDLPFLSDTFDAISSTCVLCHVGLGRYGDAVVSNGDRLALKEMARVLKPGGVAAITFGPCVLGLAKTVTLGRVHRVYSTNDAMCMAAEAGLVPVDAAMWCSHSKRWLDVTELGDLARKDVESARAQGNMYYRYLSMLLVKPE